MAPSSEIRHRQYVRPFTLTKLCMILYVLVNLTSVTGFEEDETLPRIGIIGAGISGTSSAHFMRQLFGDKAIIDVFEDDKVGGRTALININGEDYEAGAVLVHQKNRYMTGFCDLFNKEKLDSDSADVLGFYGDDELLYQTSPWMAVTLAKLAWRYGMDVYNIRGWVNDVLMPKFNRIYDFQDNGMAFTTTEDLLNAMGLDILNMTKHTVKEVLVDAGFSKRFVDEFGMAAMRNNYGQTTDVHGFVGAVSMVGFEQGLFSVKDGNKGIPESLLAASKATLVKAKVTSLALVKEGGTGSVSYELEYEARGKTDSREYDIVILASPLEGATTPINFVDFTSNIKAFSQPMQKIVAMFVQGRINKTTFGLEDVADFPSDLCTTRNDTFFNSIGKLSPITGDSKPAKALKKDHSVWKVFLNKSPSKEQVGLLFDEYEDLRFVDWLAYPQYKADMDLPPFILADRLYYVNAVESAASAMEMSVIGARNVALLAFNQWQGNFDKINELNLPSAEGDKKTEL